MDTASKSPLLLSPNKSEDGNHPGLSSTMASSIRVQRSRRASFRFSECDGDEDLPQFQGSRCVQYFSALAANMGALALGTVLSWSAVGKVLKVYNICQSSKKWRDNIVGEKDDQ